MKTYNDADRRADDLRALAPSVTGTIASLLPSGRDLSSALRRIACSKTPWAEMETRAELTELLARLTASTELLLGLCGRFDLLVPDTSELAAGLAARGTFDRALDVSTTVFAKTLIEGKPR